MADDTRPTTSRRREAGSLAAAGLSVITAPAVGALAQIAAHNETHDRSPMSTLLHKASIAAVALSATRRSTAQGWSQGRRAAERDQELRAKRTVWVQRHDLEAPGMAPALRRDLGTLAGDDRTALDLNRRLTPEAVGKRFDAAMATKGDKIRLDLASLGIRSSPGLKRALSEYGTGGREELAANGLTGNGAPLRSEMPRHAETPLRRAATRRPTGANEPEI